MSQELTGQSQPKVPRVSVVIPTYNRKESLLTTLKSLCGQTMPIEQFEVVVVDDGSNDGTDLAVRQGAFRFNHIYLHQANQGSAAARNHGARVSNGEVLVFIDDDITLCPEFLTELTDRVRPGTIAMGLWLPYEPPNANVYCRAFARQVAGRAAQALNDEVVSFTECTSNNLAVHRTDFMRVGQWQDVLGDGPTLWGDVEFGYRAWKHGCDFVRVASARAIHHDYHVSSLAVACRRAYHVAHIVQPLFQRYPEIRQHLSMFRNKEPINWHRDSSSVILRKGIRQMAWSRPVVWTLEKLVSPFERLPSETRLQMLLHQWIIGGHIFRGYSDGLRETSKELKA